MYEQESLRDAGKKEKLRTLQPKKEGGEIMVK